MKQSIEVGDAVAVHWVVGDNATQCSGKGIVVHVDNVWVVVNLTEPTSGVPNAQGVVPIASDPSDKVGHPAWPTGSGIAVPHDCWHPHPRVERI